MTTSTQRPRSYRVQQLGYRGRVRSGCLTCRSRKVKCDETRPVCYNCERLERLCVYKPRRSQQPSTTVPSPGLTLMNKSVQAPGARRSPEAGSVPETCPSPPFGERSCILAKTPQLGRATNISPDAGRDPFLSPDSSIVDVTMRLENALRSRNEMSTIDGDTEFDVASPSTLISRDIELTTTMDLLAAREMALQPSLSFFVEAVDCPSITPYDGTNWRRMKLDVVDLGMSSPAVALTIMAVSALYKEQLYNLPSSKALALYHSSKSACEKLLNDNTQDFSTILVVTFLLCLFEYAQYEITPFLKEPSEIFMKRLKTWAQQGWTHSELSSRIIRWLRLLHVTTIRGGCMGLISDSVCNLFPRCLAGTSSLSLPSTQHLDASTHLYEMLSSPIFDFYFQLQMISGEIAKLSHYHRSRITRVDQEETIQQITHIKSRLNALWEGRSATQCQTTKDLRSHFALHIANPIITLIGVCTAAYHAEFVEMDRLLGDPVSKSTDSKQAMHLIRDIIQSDWNAYDGGKLNPGYLRPLFLCAIECMNHDDNRWAVERLEQIKNPIYRSDFFASFGKALSDAQLRKERRITSKYFCIWYFGVPPPFI